MTKDKAKQPSKTALKKKLTEARREIKKQKNLIAAISEQLRNLKDKIARRDAATARFREIEPRALIAAARIYGQWKAEGAPELYQKAESTKRIKEAATASQEGEFWRHVAAEKIEDFLLLMGQAEKINLSEWQQRRVWTMLNGETRQQMATEWEYKPEANKAEEAKKEQSPGEVEE